MKVWQVIGGCALIGSIVWWRTHLPSADDAKPIDARSATRAPSSASDFTTTGASSTSAPVESIPSAPPPVPQLPEPPAPRVKLPGGASPAARFSAQPRDDRWARETETELSKRAAKLANVHVTAAECKTNACKLVIAGSDAAISAAIDALGGKRGLRGWAQSMTLSTIEHDENGVASLTTYVEMARASDDPGDGD